MTNPLDVSPVFFRLLQFGFRLLFPEGLSSKYDQAAAPAVVVDASYKTVAFAGNEVVSLHFTPIEDR